MQRIQKVPQQVLLQDGFAAWQVQEALCAIRARIRKGQPMLPQTGTSPLAEQVQWLSADEKTLLERLIQEGTQSIEGWEGVRAGIALWHRGMVMLNPGKEALQVALPKELAGRLPDAIQNADIRRADLGLFSFHAAMYGLLYLYGVFPEEQALVLLCSRLDMREARPVMQGFLRASYDWAEDPSGQAFLLHPALLNAEQGMRNAGVRRPEQVETQLLAGAMQGVLPSELDLHRRMCDSCRTTGIPEEDAEELVLQTRLLAKQGFPQRDIANALRKHMDRSIPRPLLALLTELCSETQPWGHTMEGT